MSASLIRGVDSAGNLRTVLVNSDGSLQVTGGGGGGGTTGGATEITLAEVRDKLESLKTFTDGLEGLLVSGNTTASALNAFVDQLEGYTDGLEANQAIQISRTPALGAATSANSIPVTLSTDGQFAVNFGAANSVVAASDTGTENLLALVKRLLGVKLPSALVGDRLKTETTPTEAALITETVLTTIGSTPARSMLGYNKLTYQLDLSGIGTNVVVRIEGNLSGSAYDNLSRSSLDTTLTANKTYLFTFEGKLGQVRFTIVSILGGTPSFAISLLRGN